MKLREQEQYSSRNEIRFCLWIEHCAFQKRHWHLHCCAWQMDRYALDHLPKSRASKIYERYLAFEKQHGEQDGIETAIFSKRRFFYEEQVEANALNYDAWFDYIRLEESAGDVDKVRDVYERYQTEN